MGDFSDLSNRVFYAIAIAVIGLAFVLIKPTATVLIVVLSLGFIVEVGDKLLKNPSTSSKAFWVTTAFAIVGIADRFDAMTAGFIVLELIILIT